MSEEPTKEQVEDALRMNPEDLEQRFCEVCQDQTGSILATEVRRLRSALAQAQRELEAARRSEDLALKSERQAEAATKDAVARAWQKGITDAARFLSEAGFPAYAMLVEKKAGEHEATP